MNQRQWTEVDRYIADCFFKPDPALDHALKTSAQAGLPAINVAPNQAKFLHLLARIQGAHKILEIGTLGGYSTIWLARALTPGGKLITLEINPEHGDVARANIARAGLGDVVDIRLGRALDTLPELVEQGEGPFDMTFIDADKRNNLEYFNFALSLSRPGSVIVIDNVIRKGAVADPDNTDPDVIGVRRLNQCMALEPSIQATAIQTVGVKGYDGLTIALVTD